MPTATGTPRASEAARGFGYRSSLAADVWHADPGAAAYEWWYFDALSDDGRDALVVIFLADFVFSPRYNRAASAARGDGGNSTSPRRAGTASAEAGRFPALAFCLYRDGRPFARAVNEYAAREFEASAARPSCRVGQSEFRFDEASNSFALDIREPLRGGRAVEARLSWEVTDGDLSPGGAGESEPGDDAHDWNLVAPRCRVAGRILFRERVTGRAVSSTGFAGFGYHDHNRDRRWLPATVSSWQWGRAHFDDATAVFYRYREHGDPAPTTKLFVVRGGALAAHDASLTEGRRRRDLFGLGYPAALRFEAAGAHVALSVAQSRVLDRSYFYLRFLGEAALELGGTTRRATALTEQLSPRALRWRFLDWLTDMRIGRGGRTALLK